MGSVQIAGDPVHLDLIIAGHDFIQIHKRDVPHFVLCEFIEAVAALIETGRDRRRTGVTGRHVDKRYIVCAVHCGNVIALQIGDVIFQRVFAVRIRLGLEKLAVIKLVEPPIAQTFFTQERSNRRPFAFSRRRIVILCLSALFFILRAYKQLTVLESVH